MIHFIQSNWLSLLISGIICYGIYRLVKMWEKQSIKDRQEREKEYMEDWEDEMYHREIKKKAG